MPDSAEAQVTPKVDDAVEDFVSEIAMVAKSIDPMLAVILGAGVEQPAVRKRWNRNRDSGLDFCLTMLGYARIEAARSGEARRIDRAISYILLEVARSHHRNRSLAAG